MKSGNYLMKLRAGLIILIMMLMAGACDDTDCITTNTAYVNYAFYNQRGELISFQQPVTITASGTDSILINQQSGMNTMRLPLCYTNAEDTFVVHYNETMSDSIFVVHQNIPHFISMDCGMGMYHHIDAVRSTNYAIDSIRISSPEVTYDAKEHIRIYYTDN